MMMMNPVPVQHEVCNQDSTNSLNAHSVNADNDDNNNGTVVTHPQSIPVEVGDYVALDILTAHKDWRLTLGKVLSFPTPHTIRVIAYEAVNAASVMLDSQTEAELHRVAHECGKLALWHDREALVQEYRRLVDQERETSVQLYSTRVTTRAKRCRADDGIAEALEQLQRSQAAVHAVPARQWRDLRSRADIPPSVVRLMQAVLMVLKEERSATGGANAGGTVGGYAGSNASSLNAVQAVVRQPDFLERLTAWDCIETPMSIERRRSIVQRCMPEEQQQQKGARRGSAPSAAAAAAARNRRSGVPASQLQVPATGESVQAFATLDRALREWLNAQLLCSAASRRRDKLIEECVQELQEQRVQLSAINELRVHVAHVEEQLRVARNDILGLVDRSDVVMPHEARPVEYRFCRHVRQYSISHEANTDDKDSAACNNHYNTSDHGHRAGQHEEMICLREQVLFNLGAHFAGADDGDGYITLDEAQREALHHTHYQARVAHDAEEMSVLVAQKARAEMELSELQSLLDSLHQRTSGSHNRSSSSAANLRTPEEEDEMEQLTQLMTEVQRRLDATCSRIADLYATGRGARQIIRADKRVDSVQTRLRVRMSGDWSDILHSTQHTATLKATLRNDLVRILNVPMENITKMEMRLGSLVVEFTVRHSGELDEAELQRLLDDDTFPQLCRFYESVTFKKTYPMNSICQRRYHALMIDMRKRIRDLPMTGAGVRQLVEDWDFTLQHEQLTSELLNHPDYRAPKIYMPAVSEDYYAAMIYPPKTYCETFDQAHIPAPPEPEPQRVLEQRDEESQQDAIAENETADSNEINVVVVPEAAELTHDADIHATKEDDEPVCAEAPSGLTPAMEEKMDHLSSSQEGSCAQGLTLTHPTQTADMMPTRMTTTSADALAAAEQQDLSTYASHMQTHAMEQEDGQPLTHSHKATDSAVCAEASHTSAERPIGDEAQSQHSVTLSLHVSDDDEEYEPCATAAEAEAAAFTAVTAAETHPKEAEIHLDEAELPPPHFGAFPHAHQNVQSDELHNLDNLAPSLQEMQAAAAMQVMMPRSPITTFDADAGVASTPASSSSQHNEQHALPALPVHHNETEADVVQSSPESMQTAAAAMVSLRHDDMLQDAAEHYEPTPQISADRPMHDHEADGGALQSPHSSEAEAAAMHAETVAAAAVVAAAAAAVATPTNSPTHALYEADEQSAHQPTPRADAARGCSTQSVHSSQITPANDHSGPSAAHTPAESALDAACCSTDSAPSAAAAAAATVQHESDECHHALPENDHSAAVTTSSQADCSGGGYEASESAAMSAELHMSLSEESAYTNGIHSAAAAATAVAMSNNHCGTEEEECAALHRDPNVALAHGKLSTPHAAVSQEEQYMSHAHEQEDDEQSALISPHSAELAAVAAVAHHDEHVDAAVREYVHNGTA